MVWIYFGTAVAVLAFIVYFLGDMQEPLVLVGGVLASLMTFLQWVVFRRWIK